MFNRTGAEKTLYQWIGSKDLASFARTSKGNKESVYRFFSQSLLQIDDIESIINVQEYKKYAENMHETHQAEMNHVVRAAIVLANYESGNPINPFNASSPKIEPSDLNNILKNPERTAEIINDMKKSSAFEKGVNLYQDSLMKILQGLYSNKNKTEIKKIGLEGLQSINLPEHLKSIVNLFAICIRLQFWHLFYVLIQNNKKILEMEFNKHPCKFYFLQKAIDNMNINVVKILLLAHGAIPTEKSKILNGSNVIEYCKYLIDKELIGSSDFSNGCSFSKSKI